MRKELVGVERVFQFKTLDISGKIHYYYIITQQERIFYEF